MKSYKKDKEIHIGDKVQDCDDDTKAIVLDKENLSDEYENNWIVYTENGCVETWHESDIKKINERVDLSKLFQKWNARFIGERRKYKWQVKQIVQLKIQVF